MGWLTTLVHKISGAKVTDWTLLENIADPGLDIAGKPLAAGQHYIELYVESLRLEKARRFATTFHPLIYTFASLARQGANRAELSKVTKPQNLGTLGSADLRRVITVSKRMMPATPWRGDPYGLELGLFSVKAGNVLTPLIDLVASVSEKAGLTIVTKFDPFLPLISQGLDIIAGQTDDTELELAIDTDISLAESRLYALIARPKGTIDPASVTLDKADRKLLVNGKQLEAAYCVFSIRSRPDNPDWGTIPALRDAYADFTSAIVSGKHKEAEEALAGFNRQVIVSPDLTTTDKDRLRAKARADLRDAFPGGAQAAEGASTRKRFENRTLADLDLYDTGIRH